MRNAHLLAALAAPFFLAWACSPGSESIDGAGGAGPTSTEESTTDSPSSPASTAASTGGSAGNGGTGGCDLASPNTCETAEVLMEIDGDQGTEVATIKGVGSKWFQIKILEASTSLAVTKYRATLTSAMGTDYDLYVRKGDENGPDCTFPALPATGMPETLAECFGEMGGSDDSVHLSLEVVHLTGGTCDESAQWTLTIEGHQPTPPTGCPPP